VIVRPGRRLLHAAASLVVLGLLAFAWGPILWLLAAVVLAFVVLAIQDARLAWAALNRVKASRQLPGVVGRDLVFLDALKLMHDHGSPVAGEVRDVFPPACQPDWWSQPFQFAANDAVNLNAVCRIPRRGKHRFGPIWIRVAGPWELLEVQRAFDLPGDVKVLPETFVSPDELQKDAKAELQQLDKLTKIRQQGAGTEFVTLDEFRFGDDPRRIDWRSTARHGFPIVRRYQVERHRDVLILVDCGRLMGAMTDRGSKLDCAVDSALNLARVVLDSGDRCGIGYFDSQLRGYLAPVAGPKSLRHIVECIYDLQTQWQETDYSRVFAEMQRRQAKRCLMVVLSDLGDAETSRMHCAVLERLNRRHLVLFAALRTPLIDRVIHEESTTLAGGAKQAVAMGLSRDRSRALHALRHGGIRVLDVEPQKLTVPLINQFMDLRRANRL
jgi:uncharacterized protein (DUF58 family)